jgi:hypothetical protein
MFLKFKVAKKNPESHPPQFRITTLKEQGRTIKTI